MLLLLLLERMFNRLLVFIRVMFFFILFINNLLELSVLFKEVFILHLLFLHRVKGSFLHIIFPFLVELSSIGKVFIHYVSRGLLPYSLMHNINLFNFFFSNEFILGCILHLGQYTKVSISTSGSIIYFSLERYLF